MNAQRPRRMDPDTAERLLSGANVDPRDAPEALVRLLTATCAAPHPAELVGEQAAMAAFRAAQFDRTHEHRSRSMTETILAKLLSLKVAAAVAVTVAATGGMALAATNGVLPNPLRDATGAKPSTHTTGGPSADATGRPANPHPQGSPSPSLVGLCRAYQAGVDDNPGKALENPAFAVLITAAGGREKVDAFCERTVEAESDRRRTPGNAPTGRPGGTPTTRPAGRPTDRPTSQTVAKPTVDPTNRRTTAPTAGPAN